MNHFQINTICAIKEHIISKKFFLGFGSDLGVWDFDFGLESHINQDIHSLYMIPHGVCYFRAIIYNIQ